MASRRANPLWIGAFTVGAVAIAVAAALILGSGRLLTETNRWVIFFDSSVRGLDPGAPVVFRGVVVGSVVDIHAYVDPVNMVFETPVHIELGGGAVRTPYDDEFEDEVETMNRWIREDGFRAQLKPQSLITGKLYVELGFHDTDEPPNLKGLDDDSPEIPAIPTQMEEIERSVRDAMNRIAELPVEDIANNLNRVLDRIAVRLDDPHLASAVQELDATLTSLRSLVDKVDASYDGIDADVHQTLGQLRDTLAEIDALVGETRGIVEPGSPLYYQLITTLTELGDAARALRVLSQSINEEPNQLLLGRPPSGDEP